jgi:hypothetical protein
MRSSSLVPSVLSLLAFAACSEPPVAPALATSLKIAAARAPSISPVSLVVTVSNADAAGNPYNIQDDGNGAYTDGSQNVQAVLDNSGTFAFNTQSATYKTAVRWVTYNFNSPVDPTNGYRPSPSNAKDYHFSTGRSSFSPFIPIQNLGVGANPSSECIYMGNGFSNSSTSWRVSYHKGLEDVSSSATAYAFVTRTSVTPAVWTITPVGSCSANSNVAALRSGDGTVLYGYYNVPFFFILRAR